MIPVNISMVYNHCKITVIYLHILQYVVPLLLIAPSWGTSPYSLLKVPLFQAGDIIRLNRTGI